jgi:hypothetical protein
MLFYLPFPLLAPLLLPILSSLPSPLNSFLPASGAGKSAAVTSLSMNPNSAFPSAAPTGPSKVEEDEEDEEGEEKRGKRKEEVFLFAYVSVLSAKLFEWLSADWSTAIESTTTHTRCRC